MTDQPQGTGFSTLAIHAGVRPDPARGSRTTPSDESLGADASILPSNLDALAPLDGSTDPACAMLEERVAALEGGSAALAVASGRAARLITFRTLMQPGDELIASRCISCDAADQLDRASRSFGWEVRWADPDQPERIVEALSDRTRAIFIESIADPGGIVSDIEAIASVAQRARVPLVVDNTLATPYLAHPFEHGADIVIHTAAKLLAGHHDAIGGLIVDGGSFDWSGDDRFPTLSAPQANGGPALADTFGNFAFVTACRASSRRDLGTEMSPFQACRILHGIQTLSLRMQRHSDTALCVAEHLARHGTVAWVRYAGLQEDGGNAVARRCCPRGAGAVLTFGLTDGGTMDAVVKRLKLFSTVAEAGDARSAILHPTTESPRLPPDTIRISMGLEDAADIIADLNRALG